MCSNVFFPWDTSFYSLSKHYKENNVLLNILLDKCIQFIFFLSFHKLNIYFLTNVDVYNVRHFLSPTCSYLQNMMPHLRCTYDTITILSQSNSEINQTIIRVYAFQASTKVISYNFSLTISNNNNCSSIDYLSGTNTECFIYA